jgi:zinc transport system substrate-binding protein
MRYRRLCRSLAVLLIGIAMAGPAAAAPEVIASIKPIHSLIAGVMEGVGEPGLIVAGSSSPHLYTLRPSDAQRLAQARLIFWIGPIFEGFLMKPLAALATKAEIVELDRAPGVMLLPAREGGAWEEDEHHHAGDHGGGAEAERDGHLWLDPRNAKAIVRIAVARLSTLDRANAPRYAANGAALEQRLDGLDAALQRRLAPIRGIPFVVFHDAYQYLEKRYGLSAIGSITVSPGNPPGARRLQTMRSKVMALGARCVFSEPNFEPSLVRTITEGTPAATGILDPEGTALPAGPNLYEALMSKLGDALVGCLARPS